jgi:hypothetical protein
VNTGRRGKNIERQNTKQTYYEVQLMALIIYPLVFIYNEKKKKIHLLDYIVHPMIHVFGGSKITYLLSEFFIL